MPTYFIDLMENGRRADGDEGLEFATEQAAIKFAWDWLREVLLDFDIAGSEPVIEIGLRDGTGAEIYRISTSGQPGQRERRSSNLVQGPTCSDRALRAQG